MFIKFDPDELRTSIAKQGYTIKAFAEELGFQPKVLYDALRKGQIESEKYTTILNKLVEEKHEKKVSKTITLN